MYKKIICEVTYSGKVQKVPFIIDQTGMPLEPLNAFVRAKIFESTKNALSTINQKTDNIISFLCFLKENGRSWAEVTHDRLRQFRDQGGGNKKRDRNSNTINTYLSAIYEFYWWCERKQFCEGVIGVTDVDEDDYLFPLFVYPPPYGSKTPYRIPNLLKTPPSRIRTNITTKDAWEEAYEQALDEGSIYGKRDAALILFILTTGARQVEASTTHTDQFGVDPHPKQKDLSVRTRRAKNSNEGRYLQVPVETYIEMQEFIQEDRPSLLMNRRRDAGYLFCNPNGEPLSKSHLWRILAKYGLKSHDGRSNNLTEFFVEKIREGIDQESAILLAREHAGHSQNDKSARTLKQYYLQAKAIFTAQAEGTYLEQERRKNATLQAELNLAKDRIARLECELESLGAETPTFGQNSSGRIVS